MSDTIALFPLHTVLFPEQILPLRIFETRYLDMVSRCLREQTGFGVCLIRAGNEVGEAAQHVTLGTYARIIDWQQEPDGLLGIVVRGEKRFTVIESTVKPDNLAQGQVTWVEDEKNHPVPADYQPLQDLLRQLLGQFEFPYPDDDEKLDDSVWLSNRLAELFPIDLHIKQELLELNDSIERLERIRILIDTAIEGERIH